MLTRTRSQVNPAGAGDQPLTVLGNPGSQVIDGHPVGGVALCKLPSPCFGEVWRRQRVSAA